MMPNLSPPSRAAISLLPSAERIRSATEPRSPPPMVRRSDWYEAIEINDQNGRSFGRFGRMVRFRQHLREPFVEHQAGAELGEGVDALLGRSVAHVVGA